jgi:hypothetical protein
MPHIETVLLVVAIYLVIEAAGGRFGHIPMILTWVLTGFTRGVFRRR